MEWLILLLVPIALLVFAAHALAGMIAFKELRKLPAKLRVMPRRERALFMASGGFAVAAGAVVVWVSENPEHWHTAGLVLLAVVGLVAGYGLLLLPVFTWREYRAHRRRSK